MYHSVIGKRLVQCINRRDGADYSVLSFFESKYVPLFFGSDKHLQNVGNSPFYQATTVQKLPFTPELLETCLSRVHEKVQTQTPDASFFVGGAASGVTETTSGQVTGMRIPTTHEDIYASWIGAALGLTVQGGMTLLIDSEDVLLTIYDGWPIYRRFLDQTPSLKPMQINTWNGQWLTHKFGSTASAMFDPNAKADRAALETQGWVQLLFALSYHFREGPDTQLTAYVYSLGQSNTTLGYVRLNLPQVRLPVDLYRQLFTVPQGMQAVSFEALYASELSFHAACRGTEIGLKALKPKDVYGALKGVPKPPGASDAEKLLSFQTYQIWIIAMLNNKALLQRSEALADALNDFCKRDERGKNVHKQMVEELLQKKHRRDFIDSLTMLLQKAPDQSAIFEQTVTDLLSLSVDNVSLFLTLIRFKYAVASAKA